MSKSGYPEPAFPVLNLSKTQCHGMTLRDYFAAKVLQGLLANTDRDGHYRDYAIDAYRFSDAMLKVRDGGDHE